MPLKVFSYLLSKEWFDLVMNYKNRCKEYKIFLECLIQENFQCEKIKVENQRKSNHLNHVAKNEHITIRQKRFDKFMASFEIINECWFHRKYLECVRTHGNISIRQWI